jgi:hypothetical protein
MNHSRINPINRWARLLFTSISLSALTVFALFLFCKYQLSPTPQNTLSFADALYVTNKDITKIYGPGTSVQQNIAAQFLTQEGISDMKLPQPFLYRMGLNPGDGKEGTLLFPFSPAQPEMAKLLRSATPH